MKFLDPALGGKLRTILTIAIAVLTWTLTIVNNIDWQAGVAVSIPALIGLITHFTQVGNVPPPQ